MNVFRVYAKLDSYRPILGIVCVYKGGEQRY